MLNEINVTFTQTMQLKDLICEHPAMAEFIHFKCLTSPLKPVMIWKQSKSNAFHLRQMYFYPQEGRIVVNCFPIVVT